MAEAKQEEAKLEAKVEEKKEEKEEEKEEKKEEKKEEEKKEEEAMPSPPPPPPVILHVDMHCVGCAKKIERCLLKCKGVEEVESDMANNQLKIKGVVNPQALCSRIQKKILRSVKVISPLPPLDQEAADSVPKPQVVASQVSGVSTVELHVNLHCEACAQQLRRKILKMRGVQAAETELSSGRVTVTGTMSGDKLVNYIHRRTRKLSKVISPPPSPPPPPPPKEEEKKEEGKPEDQKPPEEKKEEDKPAEEKKEDNAERKEEEKATPAPPPPEATAEEKKEVEVGMQANMRYTGPDDMVKRMMYWNGGYNSYNNYMGGGEIDDDHAKRMMTPLPWMPVYVIERPPPPPQMFSDENPNACCIS